jgi:hypothetical protein
VCPHICIHTGSIQTQRWLDDYLDETLTNITDGEYEPGIRWPNPLQPTDSEVRCCPLHSEVERNELFFLFRSREEVVALILREDADRVVRREGESVRAR